MANTIASAYVQIVPTTEGISGSLSSLLGDEATSAGASAGSKLSGALGSAVKGGVAAVATLGTAVVGAGAAITSAASNVAEYGDEIDKMSQKMGVSASFYQEWDAVLKHSGTSMNSMGATFKKLATAVQDGSDDQIEAFKQLGLSMTDLQGMSTEEVFTSVITGLQGMEEGTERTALATELLGRGAMELGPLLNTSAEDTQSMIDAVNELDGVMSDEAVKASAAFQDQLQDMQTAFTGIKNSAMSELLPSFTEIMGGLTGLATGAEGAEAQLSNGIQGLLSSIQSALPTMIGAFSTIAQSVLTVAPDIINTLATGILESIPTLLPTITDVVINIGTMLISLLPQLVTAGLEVIVQLAYGIIEALPVLIPTIVNVVLQIVDALVSNIDLLVDAALQLMIGLSNGMIAAIPVLIAKAPEIIKKLVEAIIRSLPLIVDAGKKLIENMVLGMSMMFNKLTEVGSDMIKRIKDAITAKINDMLSVGKDIVEGLKNGIANGWDSLMGWFNDQVNGLVTAAKDALKIGSPSKVFANDVGKWIPYGIAQGIEDNLGVVTNAMDDVTNATLIDAPTLATATASNSSYRNASVSGSSNNAIYDLLSAYLPQIARGGNIELSVNGIDRQLFNIVQTEAREFRRTTGYNAFA